MTKTDTTYSIKTSELTQYVPHKHKPNTIEYWCYLCKKCGQYHVIGDECTNKMDTKAYGLYAELRKCKQTIEQQNRELRELLAIKRYITNHKEWEQFYA